MHQAELLTLSMVVNDDVLDKATMGAGSMNNGHLLHQFRDKNEEIRQSFYCIQAEEQMPEILKNCIVGQKRTAREAGFKQRDFIESSQAIQLQHHRDYSFVESKGGSKGEQADYLLYDNGESLQFVPVTSKIKLNKKRHAQAVEDAVRQETSHIVLAARAYSREEERQISQTLAKNGSVEYGVDSSMVPFEGRNDIQLADKRVADMLKEMFRQHLPKVRDPNVYYGGEDENPELPVNHNDDDDFFKQQPEVEVAANTPRRWNV